MDVVSDAIAAVRVGRPSFDRVRARGRWGAWIPGYAGAGFHVVLAGSCWLVTESGRRAVRLEAGDAVLLPHGTGHALSAEELTYPQARQLPQLNTLLERPPQASGTAGANGTDRTGGTGRTGGTNGADGTGATGGAEGAELLCGKYRLERGPAHPLMRELPTLLHLPTHDGEHPELRSAVELLGAELATARPGTQLAVPALIDLLLVYLVRAWTTRPEAGGWGAALADPVVAAALAAVHTNPAHPWNAETLAARAGVSRATLNRRFTALTGRPPMAYLTWWRMTRAAALLRRGTDPLETVARQVGYSSGYALSHAFTRQFGTTPGRYRTATATDETVGANTPADTPADTLANAPANAPAKAAHPGHVHEDNE
ncbi:AraC family transcriptional regulator [Kitasatospora aureofaciens]|uniref:AraC family transcriptional regulator n=1 Tax=Kitasatospora aureofaciens TaxID=1894 RepID=UPI0037C63674